MPPFEPTAIWLHVDDDRWQGETAWPESVPRIEACLEAEVAVQAMERQTNSGELSAKEAGFMTIERRLMPPS